MKSAASAIMMGYDAMPENEEVELLRAKELWREATLRRKEFARRDQMLLAQEQLRRQQV